MQKVLKINNSLALIPFNLLGTYPGMGVDRLLSSLSRRLVATLLLVMLLMVKAMLTLTSRIPDVSIPGVLLSMNSFIFPVSSTNNPGLTGTAMSLSIGIIYKRVYNFFLPFYRDDFYCLIKLIALARTSNNILRPFGLVLFKLILI